MTNRTTAQDMEAESVDKNDATLIKSPDNSEEIVTEIPGNDDTQPLSSEVKQTSEDTHTNSPEEAAQEIAEAAPEEPEPVEAEPDYSIIAPGSLSRALKRCRKEADISLEDAAQEMRLPLSVIKALESENFSELPDPPYVRGYLRSYARLNESDSTNLINHYETLRGADPKDIASFTPVTPRYQPNSKKAVSPTTIKLAGFSMIVMLLVVLSMIPAVSQWASDTWQSFSEPQNQKLAAARRKAEAEAAANDAEQGNQDNSAQETAGAGSTGNAASTASNSDTATPDNSEQLALNQPAGNTAAQNTDATDNATGTAEQSATPEQTTDAAASDTPAGDATPAAGATDSTETAGENGTADKAQDAAGDANAEQTDPAAGDTGTPATDTNTDTAQAEATAEAEAAAKQQQEQAAAEKAAAEKAAAEKAEADRVAAQQAEAAKQEDKFQQPIDGSVLIRLVFTQDVWMSIKDGRGKTIFGALNAAGTRKELKASTPLQFKVGNAPGVQIYLNGQLIDQRPYTRGSVSTFRAN